MFFLLNPYWVHSPKLASLKNGYPLLIPRSLPRGSSFLSPLGTGWSSLLFLSIRELSSSLVVHRSMRYIADNGGHAPYIRSARRARPEAPQGAAPFSAEADLHRGRFGCQHPSLHGIRLLDRGFALRHPFCREQFSEHQRCIAVQRAGQFFHRHLRRQTQGR